MIKMTVDLIIEEMEPITEYKGLYLKGSRDWLEMNCHKLKIIKAIEDRSRSLNDCRYCFLVREEEDETTKKT